MIRVKRAADPADLESLLNRIKPDDPSPEILVDTVSDGVRSPGYTVIWREGDVVEP